MTKRLAIIVLGLALVGLVAASAQEPKTPPPPEPPKRVDLSGHRIEDKTPVSLWNEQSPEMKAYSLLLGKAWRTSREAFAGAARRHVAYEDLFSDIDKQRGEIVHVEGMMTQLRQRPAPKAIANEGLATIYQGWLRDPLFEGHKPVMVVFTALPPGLEPAEDMRKPVLFDGYLFKLVSYETPDGWTVAPLIIGQSPRLTKLKSLAMTDAQRGASAAATLVGAGPSPDMLTMLHIATISSAWPKEKVQEPPITKATRLDLNGPYIIEDNKPIPSWFVKNDPQGEPTAYSEVLRLAHKTPAKAFQAGVNPLVSYAHMFNEPVSHRGEVVQVKGTMTRLRRFDPPILSSKEDGIKDLYEGWIFDLKIYGANPVCVVFTELPKGLQVGELLRTNVTFDGYFFKRYAYESGEKGAKGKPVWRLAPLVIGHAPVVEEVPQAAIEEGTSLGTGLVMIFLALVAGTMFFALGLLFWYRRGDRHIRQRIAGASARPFIDPSDVQQESPREDVPSEN